MQAASDSALARQALEKAGLAAGSAGEAEARVLAALKLLQEMLARLSAAGSLDLVTLAELEQRLAAAEAQLEAADMLTKLDDFRRHRTQHEKLVRTARLHDFRRHRTQQEKLVRTYITTACAAWWAHSHCSHSHRGYMYTYN